MKLGKFIFVAALISCLWAIGCSDDDGPDTISCNISALGMCVSGEGTSSDCTDGSGEVVGSCPSGAELTCDLTMSGQAVTVSIYSGSALSVSNCAELEASLNK